MIARIWRGAVRCEFVMVTLWDSMEEVHTAVGVS